jgi:hypothetical protein
MEHDQKHIEFPLPSSPLFFHFNIDSSLADAITRCCHVLYDETWHKNTRTSCIFTSIVLAHCLTRMGFDARPTPVAVEGRFGIGHPDYPLTRPTAWKGHVVCMVGNTLVDPTISQVRVWGVEAPLLIALPCSRPWSPEASAALPSGCGLTWTARGANQDWSLTGDAAPRVWRPAAERLMARLCDEWDQPFIAAAN